MTTSPSIRLGARSTITPLAVAPLAARVDLCRSLTFELAVSVNVQGLVQFRSRPW